MNLILRIIISRYKGEELLGSYMMLLPTLGLILHLSQAGIPSAMLSLSTHSKNDKDLLKKSIQLTLLFDLSTLFIIPFIPSIHPYLGYMLPFMLICSVSSIIRNYYIGKSKVKIVALSNTLEEIMRMIYLIIKQNITLNTLFASMCIGELSSFLFLLYYLKPQKKKAINFSYKEILSLSIPSSLTQISHTFTHYLEPIIYTKFLSNILTPTQINTTYGILNGQVLSLLYIPTFLNTIIYRIIFPKISLSLPQKELTKKLIIQTTILCLLTGLPFTLLFYLFPNFFLGLLYHNTSGAIYLKYASIPFLLSYLQIPLLAYLQATKKQKVIFMISLIESITSLLLMTLLLPIYKEVAYLIAIITSLIINTTLSFLYVFKHLFLHKI